MPDSLLFTFRCRHIETCEHTGFVVPFKICLIEKYK